MRNGGRQVVVTTSRVENVQRVCAVRRRQKGTTNVGVRFQTLHRLISEGKTPIAAQNSGVPPRDVERTFQQHGPGNRSARGVRHKGWVGRCQVNEVCPCGVCRGVRQSAARVLGRESLFQNCCAVCFRGGSGLERRVNMGDLVRIGMAEKGV